MLEKQNSTNSQGTVKYQKEVKDTDNKTLDKNNFNKYFPKPYGYTKNGGFDKFWYDNGKFIDSAGDLDKICNSSDSNDCQDNQRKSKIEETFKFEWSGDGGYGWYCDYLFGRSQCDNIYNWSGDTNSVSSAQGFDYMYGNLGKWNLAYHLRPFYKGAWKRV